jgi:hypothetical protein
MYFTEEKRAKLIELATITEKAFSGQNQYYKKFMAINAFKANKEINVNEIKNFMKYVKTNTKMFSPFRINIFIFSSILQMGYKNPEKAFIRIRDHAFLLKENGFKKSQYQPMACYTLDSLLFADKIQDMAIQTESYRVSVAEKGKEVYEYMKVNHPWITGGDDYCLALIIAHANKDMERIERVYNGLNERGLKKGNDLQSLSNILCLTDDIETDIIDRVILFMEKSKKNGLRINTSMYTGLGLIALVEDDHKHLEHVIEVTNELKKTKKFKWIDKQLLFMFAVAIVSEDLKQELSTKTVMATTLSVTIEELIMAQTAVMIAAITATTAASTAANV